MKYNYYCYVFSIIFSATAFSGCERDNFKPSDRQLDAFTNETGFYYGSPTLVDGFIYIGTSRGINYEVSANNVFLKLDANLKKAWSYPLGIKEVRGSATLDDVGNIYFVTDEGRSTNNQNPTSYNLVSLNNNGILRWSKFLGVTYQSVGMTNPAISEDNIIYVGGSVLYAFDKEGNQVWFSTTNSMWMMNAPIIDPEGNIYFKAFEGGVISLDKNGGKRWVVKDFGMGWSSPAFSVDYSKVFIAGTKTVCCLEASTGNILWEFSVPFMSGDFRATPAIDDHDNIYLGTKADENSVFYAIKSDGSGLLWKREIGADLYCSPALGNDKIIYVGSERADKSENRLHAIDIVTGEILWAAPLPKDITWSSPAISMNDGILYVGTMDHDGVTGGVYSFKTSSTGLMSGAGSPRFHEGNASTGRRD